MKVKWLGHASFLLTSQNGTRIITDPYEPGFRQIINYSKIEEPTDIVSISHEHGDHNYVSSIPGKPEVVRGNGRHEVKGIIFNGLPSYHDKRQGSERGPNTIFCFTLDKIRIAHLGDLGHMPNDDVIAELKGVDILLIPTGGPLATLDMPEVEDLCQRIEPKIIIPMHFKTDKCTFPKYTVNDFIQGKDSVSRPGSSEVELSKEMLPPTTEILVLEHAL